MKEYAVCDIGSNTIVMIIYEICNGKPVQKYYESDPVHLISYVEDGIMSAEGIAKASAVLMRYKKTAQERGITSCWACITEPCRVSNRDELVAAFSESGFEIYPLSGAREAALDFKGSRLSWPEISEGIAFDVGGGSTELIAFENGECTAAVSFPLGCVRLFRLPLDTPECAAMIEKCRRENPELAVSADTLIGIGGTVRAAARLCTRLYGTGNIIPAVKILDIFRKLQAGDEACMQAFLETIDPGRQPVFLSGIHMILEIIRIYRAKLIYVSETGIREGFLLETLEHTAGSEN